MQDRHGNRMEMNGKDNLGRTPNTSGVGGVQRSVMTNTALLSQRLRSGYISKTSQELFPGLPYANGGPPVYSFAANPLVVSEVVLPDGRKYEFFYNSYGELARVVLPTGGAIEYDFGPLCVVDNVYCMESGLFVQYSSIKFIKRAVRERRLYNSVGSLETKTKFTPPLITPFYQGEIVSSLVEVFDNANNRLSKTKSYYQGMNSEWYASLISNRPFKTEIYDESDNIIRITEDLWEESTVGTAGGGYAYPRLNESKLTIVETGQVSKQSFAYDGNNYRTDVFEYDYGVGGVGEFKRRTHTDYLNDTSYTAGAHIRGLPTQTWISSDYYGTNKVSLSQIEYLA
jgi:hypothetical protein